MATYQGIKLVTGEELVAKVMFVTPEGECTVSKPLVLHVSTGPQGLVVNFYPWTIIAEGDDIRIEAHAIVARYSIPKEVEANYIQNTSGLQIVSAANAPQILKG